MSAAHTVTTTPTVWWKNLYIQVLIAIIIGVFLGHFYPHLGESMKPLGDGFIKMVKFVITPVIFCTVIIGIVGTGGSKKVGKIGGLALLYFEVVSTLALVIGLVVIEIIGPGRGMNINAADLASKADSIANYTKAGAIGTVPDFILNIIPSQIFDAFAKGEILQVLFLAILTGFAMQHMGGRDAVVYKWLENASQIVFEVVRIIMYLAPIGAFGAMAFTIGKYGVGALVSLGSLMATFYITCLLFIIVVLGVIAAAHGFSIFRMIAYIKEELLLVLGTSSSETALPRLITKLEAAGAEKSVVGLVVPAGYSFNLDGTSIYLTMAAVFIAQATNTELTLAQELTLLAVLLLTSKGAAGVTGSGFIVLASTLAVVPTIPLVGITLILGIDRFMSEGRAITNFIGNSVATLVIAKWQGQVDETKFKQTVGFRSK